MPAQTAPKTSEDIAEVIRSAATVAETFGAALKALDPELSFTHWTLLSLLRSDGPTRPFQAAARLKLSRQLVYQTAKKLGRLGFVDFSSEKDRRAVVISLSPKGAMTLERVDADLATIAAGLNERAPAAALRPLRNVLAYVANRLSHQTADGSRPKPKSSAQG
jgi:DNA-binding MarR family transcriptional regulator